MIFKIVRHIEGEGVSNSQGDIRVKVVPKENRIWEAPSAIYKKVRVETRAAFEDHMNNNYGSVSVVYTPQLCSCDGIKEGCSNCKDGFEFIELFLDGSDHAHIFCGANLFVMNNEGKTVDTLHCPLC